MAGLNVKITKLDQKENVFEVCNFWWLGPSEIKQIQDVYDTVVRLIKKENKLSPKLAEAVEEP